MDPAYRVDVSEVSAVYGSRSPHLGDAVAVHHEPVVASRVQLAGKRLAPDARLTERVDALDRDMASGQTLRGEHRQRTTEAVAGDPDSLVSVPDTLHRREKPGPLTLERVGESSVCPLLLEERRRKEAQVRQEV